MKSASAGLIALLNSSNQFYIADIYTFTLNTGGVLRYASSDGSLTVGGNTFDGTSVLIERSKIRTVIGVEVDTLDLTITALPTQLIGSTALLQALRNGAMDWARVKVERCFMPTWGDTSLGTITLFTGFVADMDIGRLSATIRVNSDMSLLNVQMPRNLYQPGCQNTLYDPVCTAVKASFGVAATVGISGSTASTFPSNLINPTGYFDLGTVTWATGANAGLSNSVKQYVAGSFTLNTPLLSVPQPGDTFTAFPGCDKTQATCTSKFNNVINFRGFPYIPVPESVV
jgi:uncharacterized phage protein (TIGR02218 family)